jgi:hypothetical protein
LEGAKDVELKDLCMGVTFADLDCELFNLFT